MGTQITPYKSVCIQSLLLCGNFYYLNPKALDKLLPTGSAAYPVKSHSLIFVQFNQQYNWSNHWFTVRLLPGNWNNILNSTILHLKLRSYAGYF